MEWKDYWTIGASLAALIVSIFALRVSTSSYRLARERDERDLEREKPLIELEFPSCYGRGPWTVSYRVANRGPEPLLFTGVRLPINMGRTAVVRRSPFRFADAANASRISAPAAADEAGDYELARLDIYLAPGKAHEGNFEIMPEPRDRVKSNSEFRAYFDFKVSSREETNQSLRVIRKV